ncbi:MAG: hypothetical protein KDE32_04170 [Novosphingobium sp.]|nr:hypothetical protein [Novosphingobium sp.]
MAGLTVVARIANDIREVLTGHSLPHVHLRDRLAKALALTITVDILASLGLFALEGGIKGSDIHTYWDAFYFVTAQLTTLSSAMANPVSPGGEVLVLLINVYAITVVAALAGIFGGFFAHRAMDLRDRQAKQGNGDHSSGQQGEGS